MSTKHSRNKNTTKKRKLDEVDESVSSIAEYKRCAILKFCKENGIETNQLKNLFISKKLHKLGLYYFFKSIILIDFECYQNIFILNRNNNSSIINIFKLIRKNSF